MTVTGAQYTATRVRGAAPWNPTAKTQAVLDQVQAVLAEFRSYLPMTARQVFYRLVGAYDFPKSEQAYSRLLEYLNRARRAGMVPWHAIRDDGFASRMSGGYDSPDDWVEATKDDAERYRRDRQHGQDRYLELWVEAEGMMPQAHRVAVGYGIPVYSSGGFNSVTAKYTTARRIARRDVPTTILHVGDYDPSGLAVIDSLADDVQAFLYDWGHGDYGLADFVRVAVTPEQIDRLGLPGAPPKRNDRRGDFTGEAVQAEAMSPDQLAGEIREAIADHFDMATYQSLLDTEADERQQLVAAVADITVT